MASMIFRRSTDQRHDSTSTSGRSWAHTRGVAGPVEDAVRGAVPPGDRLATPSGRGQFTVAQHTADGLVLLLGEREAWTPLPWRALEQVPDFLRGRGWVLIGSVYSMNGQPDGLGAFPEAGGRGKLAMKAINDCGDHNIKGFDE
jgi:hypothetical protein